MKGFLGTLLAILLSLSAGQVKGATANHNRTSPRSSLTLVEMLPPIGLAGMAAVVIPNLIRAREQTALITCFSNQRTIRVTIQQWSVDKKKPDNAAPTEDDLRGYFEGGKMPKCPAGGNYDLATVEKHPSCSRHGSYIDEEEEGVVAVNGGDNGHRGGGGEDSLEKVVPVKLIANPIVEKEVRKELKKPAGELTKADLEKVKTLNLFSKQLTDVKGLEKLTKLTHLHLHRNRLTNVKGLEKLMQLTVLDLSYNQLTNVKSLEKLTQLTSLGLYKNQLTEVPKGLEKLTQLRELLLGGNPDITKAQIAELQKALPKCKILSNPKK